MENASKALIMAGAVLLSILIVSLGVMVFKNMSGSVKNDANLDKQKITAFNSRITPYLGNHISGSQVNSLIQLARTIDQKSVNEGDTVQIITITGVGTVSVSGNTVTSTNVQTVKYYKVSGTYDSNGLITQINITE